MKCIHNHRYYPVALEMLNLVLSFNWLNNADDKNVNIKKWMPKAYAQYWIFVK